MSASRPKLSKHTESQADAVCLDCAAWWDSRNALTTAAHHASKYGHRVEAHLDLTVTYDGSEVDQ